MSPCRDAGSGALSHKASNLASTGPRGSCLPSGPFFPLGMSSLGPRASPQGRAQERGIGGALLPEAGEGHLSTGTRDKPPLGVCS